MLIPIDIHSVQTEKYQFQLTNKKDFKTAAIDITHVEIAKQNSRQKYLEATYDHKDIESSDKMTKE